MEFGLQRFQIQSYVRPHVMIALLGSMAIGGQYEKTGDFDRNFNDCRHKLCKRELSNYEPSFRQHDEIGLC